MKTSRGFGIRIRWVLPWALLMSAGGVIRAEKAASPETAMQRLGQGDAVGARRDYEALLAKRPDDARLAFNAGLAAYRHQDWEGASRHFESALGSSDLQLQQRAFLALGNSRSRQGEAAEEVADKTRLWEDAVQQYQAALGLDASDTDSRFNLEAVREQLARLPKPEQDPKDQKDPKNQKDSKDKKDSKDQKDPKDPKSQEDQQKDDQEGKKQDDGKPQDPKSKEGQDGKQQDSKQQGMGGQDSKKDPKDGQGGKEKPEKGKPGDPDGKDSKEQQKPGESGKDAKQGKDAQRGEKGDEGKDGQSGEAGEDGQSRPGQPGTAGRGQPGRDPGEDSADGRMAVRFAERLLDGHKQDEKALIWRPATQAREPQRGADGRRKTW